MKKLASPLILIFTVILTVIAIVFLRTHLSQIDYIVATFGWFGPLLLIFLYSILSLTPFPTDPITITLGAVYGPIIGLLISWAGNTAAALLEFFVAHHIGNVAKFDKLKHKLPLGLAKAPIDSLWFLTLGRIVPGWGSKVVSVLAGLYNVPIGKYLWTTALMNFVGSIVYILLGFILVRWF